MNQASDQSLHLTELFCHQGDCGRTKRSLIDESERKCLQSILSLNFLSPQKLTHEKIQYQVHSRTELLCNYAFQYGKKLSLMS